MIPKIIWQTYKDKYEILPQYIIDCIETWKILNPEYEYKYMDDYAAEEFILNEFGLDWYNIFKAVPLGVMRGDIWRYLVIYKYGGVYADIDTICKKPISQWLNNKYDFIVADDGDGKSFCQYIFAAKKEHELLLSVIDLIKNKFNNPDYTNKNFVHELTGVNVWTKGIKNGLKTNKTWDPKIYHKAYNVLNKAKEYKFFCFGGENANIFNGDAVEHLTGSLTWNHKSYVQWQNEIKKIMENKNE
jgi:hypothetical protein